MIGDDQVGRLPIAADGTYAGVVTVPSALAPGGYQLDATGCHGVEGVAITVGRGAGVVPGSATEPLARTGADLGTLGRPRRGRATLGAAALYGSQPTGRGP